MHVYITPSRNGQDDVDRSKSRPEDGRHGNLAINGLLGIKFLEPYPHRRPV